jgi:hypothetical protein
MAVTGCKSGLYAAAVSETSDVEAHAFVDPARVWSRREVLTRPSPVPEVGGIYGWWFRRLPPLVDASDCCQHEDLGLLYVGISPRRPPGNCRVLRRQGLRRRLETHYAVEAATIDRLVDAGGTSVASRNPYWDYGGVTITDPDGYRLVLTSRSWP